MASNFHKKSEKPVIIHLPFTPKMELLLIKDEKVMRPIGGLQYAMPFEEDGKGGWVFSAKSGSDKWGYLNHQGEWIIPPTLDDAKTFSEGIARYRENNLWGFINISGEKITQAIYTNATAFQNGFARVQENGLWGFINNQGKKVISSQFYCSTNFCNGFASIEIKPGEWKIINNQGEFTCKHSFSLINEFSKNGLAAAVHSNEINIGRNKIIKFGFINTKGEWIIEPKFADAKSFKGGYAPASLDRKNYGLIDQKGNWFIEPEYDRIDSFNHYGLAFYENNGYDIKHGFIDTQGKTLIKGGYDLKSHIPCGIAREKCSYINTKGEKLPAIEIQYGTDFDEDLQAAIVNIKSERPLGHWFFLQPSGEIHKVSDSILEPLVTDIGWVDLQFSSSAVPFLNVNNGVSWLNRKAEEIYSATLNQGVIELKNAQGKILWQSSEIINAKMPASFFNPDSQRFLKTIKKVDAITEYAKKLLTRSEERLHKYSKNETLTLDMQLKQEDDNNYEELFELEEEDLEYENINEDILQHYLVCEHQKILYLYQNEFHTGTYEFLWNDSSERLETMKASLVDILTQAFGEPDPDPEYVSYWGRPDGLQEVLAWPIPLKSPLSNDSQLPDTNQQWLILYTNHEAGDGDQWLDIWLLTAPSSDAIYVANALRNKKSLEPQQRTAITVSHKIVTPEVDIPELPEDYQGWLEMAKQHYMNIGEIPEKWIDDQVIDAAIAANVKALAHTPAKWQTAERLKKLITKNLKTALQIPPQCMTDEGLRLARSLYESDPDWNSHDSRLCELPIRWDQDSFYQIWGCLLDNKMAHKGITGGASLSDLAVWLRTEELETLSVQNDIDNLRYIEKNKIASYLIALISKTEYKKILESLPFELLTSDLCLKFIINNSASLDEIPVIARTVDVCAAALKNDIKNFVYVPDKYRIRVINELIQKLSTEAQVSQDSLITDLYNRRAWANLWAKDYQGAIDDINRSIRIPSNEADAHYILASAHLKLGKVTEACHEAIKVLSIDSNYQTPWIKEKTQWLNQLVQNNNENAKHTEHLSKNPSGLKDMPRELITNELIDIATATDPTTIRFVPKRFMNSDRYLIAVTEKQKYLRDIPRKFLTESICVEYVKNNGWKLNEVPEEFKTLKVFVAAVKNYSYAIRYVPGSLKSEVESYCRIEENHPTHD